MPRLESLEQRLPLSGSAGLSNGSQPATAVAAPSLPIAEFSYQADGRDIPLDRDPSAYIIRRPAASPEARPIAVNDRLDGWTVTDVLRDDLVVVEPERDPLGPPQVGPRNLPEHRWASPVLRNQEQGTRLLVGDELIAELASGVKPEQFADQFVDYRRVGGTTNQFVFSLDQGGDETVRRAAALARLGEVVWASPNVYHDVRRQALPNDPLFSQQWHLHNTGQTGATNDADPDLPLAWDLETGRTSPTVIAVLDDGVQTNHPDLNIFVNQGEIPNNGIDDDGNGWVDDRHGYDFIDGDPNPNPGFTEPSHGTAVAGVAAGIGNNGIGVSGAAQDAIILPVRMLGGSCSSVCMAESIRYAAGITRDGLRTWDAADVLNNSWGFVGYDAIVASAFADAAARGRHGQGAVSVASSGNYAAAYQPFLLPDVPPGNWIFEWRYQKDFFGFNHDDAVWLANVGLPNGTVERFDAAAWPAGWQTYGHANWFLADQPSRSYGTGRYVMQSGPIFDGQTTVLRSPLISVTTTRDLTYWAWISTQVNSDSLTLHASADFGASFGPPLLVTKANDGVIQNGFSGFAPSDPLGRFAQDVLFPANLETTIAVGSSTDWDYRASYSLFGPSLDLVAPSAGDLLAPTRFPGSARIVTTDQTGSAGYATGSYTSVGDDGFGGTSSASPLAAGIAALVLAKNPDLTFAQVRQILRSSTDKIGGLPFPFGRNDFYGYGRINARAALDATPTPATQLTIAPFDADKAEGTGAERLFSFTVVRTGSLSRRTWVDYEVQGTGTSPADGGDFLGILADTLLFEPGEELQAVFVRVAGDAEIEDDESFQVALSNPTGAATLSTAVATGVIRNDDLPPPLDFGDAPPPYPVTRSQDGARHRPTGPRLGPLRDDEADGTRSANATADGSDEDGVAVGPLSPGQLQATVNINVQNAPSGALLDGWIDFNQDGSWGGPGEHIFDAVHVAPSLSTLTFDVPAWAVAGETFARFRLRSNGRLGPRGEAADGEVEDHQVTISAPRTTNGEFTVRQTLNNSAVAPETVFAADVDGDGDMDVLSSSFSDDRIAWYENDNGNFTSHTITNTAAKARSVFATDLDGDGDTDVLSASRDDDTIAWYENDGSQRFAAHIISFTSTFAIAVSAADLDADGDMDVLAASEFGNHVSWFENDGSQSFSERPIPNSANGAAGIFAVDLDRDGDMDVLSTGFGANQVAWHENDGQQGFTERIVSSTTLGPLRVVAVDLDRDGQMDILSSSFNDNSISWHRNNGSQNFSRQVISAEVAGASGLFAGDVDGDGDVDVLGTSITDHRVILFENDGSQQFEARDLATDAIGAWSVFATDLDGDRDLDILSASSGDHVIGWYENGDSVPPQPVISTTATDPTSLARIPISIDFGEAVNNFVPDDVEVVGGLIDQFQTADQQLFEIVVTPWGDGVLTINVPAGVAEDGGGNANLPASTFSIRSDRLRPTPTIRTTATNPTNLDSIPIEVSFDEAVSGFAASDLVITGATATDLTSTDSRTFRFDLEPNADGPVTVDIAADVAADAAGNTNIPAARLSLASDRTGPTILAIQRHAPLEQRTNVNRLVFRVTYDEPVVDVGPGDFVALGSEFASVVDGQPCGDTCYEVTISGSSRFTGTLTISQALTQQGRDAAGNAVRQRVPDVSESYTVVDWDFGDAPNAAQTGFPSDYPTTLAADGARHVISNLTLGGAVDHELDGLPSPDAGSGNGGDDQSGQPDEDGVHAVATAIVTATTETHSSLSVVASQAGLLDAWIDFNQDGDWDEANEQVFSSQHVTGGLNVLNFAVPANSAPGTTFGRFRLSSIGNLAPTGEALDGEVEDHRLSLLDGNATGGAGLDVAVPAAAETVVAQTGGGVAVRHDGVRLFAAPRSAVAAITVQGTDGDDLLTVEGLDPALLASLSVDGGDGTDTLRLAGAEQQLDLRQPAPITLRVERLDVTGSGPNSLALDSQAVRGISATTPPVIHHDSDDTIEYSGDWRVAFPVFQEGGMRHVLREEGTDTTLHVVNTQPWQNPRLSWDVNRDGVIAPNDVLRIINTINADGPRALAVPQSIDELPSNYYDMNGDSFVTANDALVGINFLNNQSADGEGARFETAAAGNGLVGSDRSTVVPPVEIPLSGAWPFALDSPDLDDGPQTPPARRDRHAGPASPPTRGGSPQSRQPRVADSPRREPPHTLPEAVDQLLAGSLEELLLRGPA